MKTRRKIWFGVGAAVVVGAGTTGVAAPVAAQTTAVSAPRVLPTDTAIPLRPGGHVIVAQHAGHAQDAGEGGEAKGLANLPPELAFAARIALLRGHLLVGDELVKQQQWNAALPHFLHPGEEIYGDIRDQLADYKVPPVEALKTATGEYQAAIVDGKIAKPVEYQDARGFILQAERMIESVAPDLQKKDAKALADVQAGLAQLKKAFPASMPPKTPVKDPGAVLADVSRIELAAGKLM